MKIAVVGLGKMGQTIAAIAEERKHEVVRIDPNNFDADFSEVDEKSLQGVDAGIEFTHPGAVLENIKKFCDLKTNLVVGTSGWYDELPSVVEQVTAAQNGVIYASNFSIGVNVFFKVAEQAAKIIDKFPDFDVSAIDIHHNQKVDSPSGTAVTLSNILTDAIRRKDTVVYDKLDRKPEPNEIHFASLRAGAYPGEHQLIMDSPGETVSLKVSARNRSGYALGSVIAAEWIHEKAGFYSFENLIEEIIQGA